jgi:hypothetical protein
MIFFGHVSAAGILELDHPELYGDLLKAWNAAAHDKAQRVGISLAAVPQVARTPSFFLNASRLSLSIAKRLFNYSRRQIFFRKIASIDQSAAIECDLVT